MGIEETAATLELVLAPVGWSVVIKNDVVVCIGTALPDSIISTLSGTSETYWSDAYIFTDSVMFTN